MADEHGRRARRSRCTGSPATSCADEIGSTAFFGGVVLERTGGLQPAAFHAGLARLALDAGADVHDHTTAIALELAGLAGRRATSSRTSRGTVDAPRRDRGHQRLRRRAGAAGCGGGWCRSARYIIATEVLDPEVAASVSPRDRMLVDTKNFLFYWRLSPDGRMRVRRPALAGRRRPIPEARDFLHAAMVRLHPQLRDVDVEYAWGGNVAITLDRMPHFGRVPRGPAEGALVRHRVQRLGRGPQHAGSGAQAADVVSGGAEPPAFAEIGFPAVPAHALRRPTCPVVGQWFGYQDRRP